MAMGQPSPACIARMGKELKQLELEPPPGISAWPLDGKINALESLLQGPTGTPYEGGTFKLEIMVPDRYPFEPPKIRFITPIYHPNIDSGGRICLDTLNMPPKGEWKPAVNLCTVLASIQLLLSDPNPDDGLMPEITQEYKQNRARFEATARETTRTHAIDGDNATLRAVAGKAGGASAGAQTPGGGAHSAATPGGGGRGVQEQEEEEEDDSDEDGEEAAAALFGKPAQAPSAKDASHPRDGKEEGGDAEEEEEVDIFADQPSASKRARV